jgi:hypothetical protein
LLLLSVEVLKIKDKINKQIDNKTLKRKFLFKIEILLEKLVEIIGD